MFDFFFQQAPLSREGEKKTGRTPVGMTSTDIYTVYPGVEDISSNSTPVAKNRGIMKNAYVRTYECRGGILTPLMFTAVRYCSPHKWIYTYNIYTWYICLVYIHSSWGNIKPVVRAIDISDVAYAV